MEQETNADLIARTLAEREWTLGTVECGVNGIVSRRLFDAPDGPVALGNSLILDEVEKAVELLGLPRVQFKRAGDFSAKAARAAAREGQAFLGVRLCLAVWAPPPDSTPAPDEQVVYVAFNTGKEVIEERFPYEGTDPAALDRLADRTLQWILDLI